MINGTLRETDQATLARREDQSCYVPFSITELRHFDGDSQQLLSLLTNLHYLKSTSPSETAAKPSIAKIPRCLQAAAGK